MSENVRRSRYGEHRGLAEMESFVARHNSHWAVAVHESGVVCAFNETLDF